MSTGPWAQSTPNLFRTVAECTQPYGPPASAASVRALQSYLTNDRCVDSVYRAILVRACAEPQSEAVIAKCIALVKQYAGRHKPSPAVLEAIVLACQRLAASLPVDSTLHRSLQYLESSVARMASSTLSGRQLAKLSSSASRSQWLQAAVNGEAAGQRSKAAAAGSVQSSVSDEQTRAGLAAAGVGGRCAAAALQAAVSEDDQEEDDETDDCNQQHQQQGHGAGQLPGRLVPPQAGWPAWTFQPSALQELWLQAPESDEEGEEEPGSGHEADLDWSALLPCYSPSLVPLVEGLPGMEVLHMLSCQDILDAVTDADQHTRLRQMREIAEVRRKEVSLMLGTTPEFLQQALSRSKSSRPRRLFRPPPYTQQEPLAASSSDVAAVVEVLCGKPSPSVPSAIFGTVGLDDPSQFWLRPPQPLQQPAAGQGGQQQLALHSESVGQISGCILAKLILDLWLGAGPVVAFPLVLRMLQQALYQPHPDHRARAFDVLFNLSLHGCMLVASSAQSASPMQQQQQQAAAAADMQVLALLQQYQQQQQVRPAPPPAAAAGGGDCGSASSLASSDGLGSPPSRGSSRSMSPLPSPRVHLPPQLLGRPQPSPLQAAAAASAAAAAAAPAVAAGSSGSQLPSPKGRSRLSRSELRFSADQQPQASGSSSSLAGIAAAADASAGEHDAAAGARPQPSDGAGADAAVVSMEAAWESWLQQLLYELLLMLAEVQEPCEAVWQSAVGCLLQLTTHAGHWVAPSLSSLPPAAAAALLDACIAFDWSQELHAHLVQLSVNLLYVTDAAAAGGGAAGGLAWTRHTQQQQQQGPGGSTRQQGRVPRRQSADGLEDADSDDETASAASGSSGGASSDATDSASGSGSSSSSSSSSAPGGLLQQQSSRRSRAAAEEGRGQAAQDFEPLPCRLHGGPVNERQLAAFGGPQKLLQHFCHAASIEAQRTLLVPLLQVLMPPDAPDAAQLAIMQALCSRPNCLAALAATLPAGLPGWADPVLAAMTQQLEHHDLDLQLLASVLLRLEALAASQPLGGGSTSAGSDTPTGAAGQLPGEVEVAMQVTLLQLAGQIPCLQQVRPGLQGAAETTVFQAPAEVQGCWRALKALCWCDDASARRLARVWLQRLLELTLQQSLEGTILLPLPGVTQRGVTAPAAGEASGEAAAAAATAAGIIAACDAWVEVLQQLVSLCPKGPDTLVDALQLHIISCKLQAGSNLASGAASGATTPSAGSGTAGSSASRQRQQQQQRAAVARVCVQAWAFVCQWVMQARTSSCQAALTRLAAIAQSLACVIEVPRSFTAAAAMGPAAAAAAMQGLQAGAAARADAAEAAADEAAGLAAESSRDKAEAAAVYKGVPPPEISSEPSALAALWAEDGAAAAGAGWGCSPDAAAAALAAAEAVCWPQAFLLGQALLPQQMAQVLSGASLALLLVRLLQCKQHSTAADRGFHGRPATISTPAAAAALAAPWQPLEAAGSQQAAAGPPGVGGAAAAGVLPCPVLYPWSEGRLDLQLSLILMLISSCSGDVESIGEFGLEAVTQQVLSGCNDPRASLLLSRFMLEHLMRTQQERYWACLRHLLTTAQQRDDERLLGNPFLQLTTLLQQQQQPGEGATGPAAADGAVAAGGGAWANSGVAVGAR